MGSIRIERSSHVWGTGQDQMRIVKQRLVEMCPRVTAANGGVTYEASEPMRFCVICTLVASGPVASSSSSRSAVRW